MKKFSMYILIVTLLLTMTACGRKNKEPDTPENDTSNNNESIIPDTMPDVMPDMDQNIPDPNINADIPDASDEMQDDIGINDPAEDQSGTQDNSENTTSNADNSSARSGSMR